MRILLIEDDRMIGQSLVHALRDDGHGVDWVRDGISGETALSGSDAEAYALILLDWNLPGRSGIALLRDLRQRGLATPVLVITARESAEDMVAGLDTGADDYLIKPFEISVLRARIRALVRRRSGGPPHQRLAAAGVELDLSTRKVLSGGKSVHLTPREFTLLQALLERPGTVLSRQQLEERIYGWDESVVSNAIEFLIHSLRRKLGPDVVQNVRGVGWCIGGGA
ncbi:MAG TPA: response regulator transcription factor [Nevskia sp.]|nr:response regulator transcription factor [Nevskia sp.]